MKKAVILILAILYFGITSGVMVNIHYCMGEIAAVSYGHEDDNQCGQCGMEDMENCCHTESQLVKSDNAHLATKAINGIVSWEAVVATAGFYTPDEPILLVDPPQPLYHAPPDKHSHELRILNGVFRI